MGQRKQLDLPFRPWGGRRRGAGRKRTLRGLPRVPHRPREAHRHDHLVHTTMRVRRGIPSLRLCRLVKAVADAIRRSSNAGFRVVEMSVQADHMHLIVEADDQHQLGCGMRGLAIRVARAINRELGRRGSVWNDRWHGRELKTPREVRNALVYVLCNRKKHDPNATGLDPCSSATWFSGWKGSAGLECRDPPSIERPTVAARSWLARKGWHLRGGGFVGIEERPRSIVS